MMMLKIFGSADSAVLDQMQNAMEKSNCDKGVLCADNHLGYCVPVGGVIALENSICVNGVGYDIACGNKAVRLDVDIETVQKNISVHMDELVDAISFGVGGVNKTKVDSYIFDLPIWNEIPLLKELKQTAECQLGTVGSGNHYVDIFKDELNRIWVGVHFGSRGLGHAIASHFVKLGEGKDGILADPVVFSVDSDLGEQYLKCMELAGKYAYAGRDWVCQKVAQILGGSVLEEVHNHHNFAWKETHHGKEFWVIRKGATPAFPDQKGFVGGSMGDVSVILEGIECESASQALYSTIHGAGRVMGRMEAKGKRHKKTGELIREGKISRSQMTKWIEKKGVELRGADVDEAPQAYKRIEKVLESHVNTVRILHTLEPLGVAMAS